MGKIGDPGKDGPAGKEGPTGPRGPAGPQGLAGAVLHGGETSTQISLGTSNIVRLGQATAGAQAITCYVSAVVDVYLTSNASAGSNVGRVALRAAQNLRPNIMSTAAGLIGTGGAILTPLARTGNVVVPAGETMFFVMDVDSYQNNLSYAYYSWNYACY